MSREKGSNVERERQQRGDRKAAMRDRKAAMRRETGSNEERKRQQ